MDFVPKSFVVTHGYHFMVWLLCISVQSLLAPTPLHLAHQQPISKLIKFYVTTTIIIPKGTRNRSGHLIGPTLSSERSHTHTQLLSFLLYFHFHITYSLYLQGSLLSHFLTNHCPRATSTGLSWLYHNLVALLSKVSSVTPPSMLSNPN